MLEKKNSLFAECLFCFGGCVCFGVGRVGEEEDDKECVCVREGVVEAGWGQEVQFLGMK